MKHPILSDVVEATRLTRQGRVGDATALLLHRLRTPTEGSAHPVEQRPTQAAQSTTSKLLRRFAGGLGWTEGKRAPGLRKPAVARPAAVVPPGGRFIAGSYTNHAGSRAYKLYIPSFYRGQAVPLVVMLHGCTQSPDNFAAGTRMNYLAENNTCLVVYPEQPISANPSKCWNWFSPSHQRRDEGEPSLIAGIARQIMQEYAVDPRRVYVAGLSAGAAAASILAMTYPDLYAAVGVHSGLAPGAASDLASARLAMQCGPISARPLPRNSGLGPERVLVPTIVFHGDRDTRVNPRNGDDVVGRLGATAERELEQNLQRGKVPGGHSYSRTLYRDGLGRTVLEQWLVHGLDHAWSGGSPEGSYTDPLGPDASREILRFFLEHPHV